MPGSNANSLSAASHGGPKADSPVGVHTSVSAPAERFRFPTFLAALKHWGTAGLSIEKALRRLVLVPFETPLLRLIEQFQDEL